VSFGVSDGKRVPLRGRRIPIGMPSNPSNALADRRRLTDIALSDLRPVPDEGPAAHSPPSSDDRLGIGQSVVQDCMFFTSFSSRNHLKAIRDSSGKVCM
jgi:hypothetical protein